MKRLAALLVAGAVLTACGGSTSGPSATKSTVATSTSTNAAPIHTRGDVLLFGAHSIRAIDAARSTCTGAGSLSAVAAGAQVSIADDKGATLAITQLIGGTGGPGAGCVFNFTADVPSGKGFYTVTVAGQPSSKEAENQMVAGIAITITGA